MTRIGKLAFLLYLFASGNCQAAPPGEARQQLVRLLQSTKEPLTRRIAAAEKLSTIRLPGETILVKVMEESSQDLQRVLARQLALSPRGAEILLKSIEQGKASPRLLEQAPIRDALQQARVPGLGQRREKLLENLLAADEEIAPLIRERGQGFLAATTTP